MLVGAVEDGIGQLLWEQDTFAFADSYDETAVRYRDLRGGQMMSRADSDLSGLLVKPEVARAQLNSEQIQPPTPATGGQADPLDRPGLPDSGDGVPVKPTATQPKRFHGTVVLDATRVGRDAGRIADEVIAHLAGLVDARVTVTLEIEAEIPSGAPAHVVRAVTENSRTLRFSSQGFEEE